MARNHNYAGQLRQHGSDLMTDLKDMGSTMKDAAAAGIGAIKEKASGKLTMLGAGARERGVRARDAVGDVVARSPWRSMFLVAGAGLLAGWLLRRR